MLKFNIRKNAILIFHLCYTSNRKYYNKMRFKLKLELQNLSSNVIPINYQYELSSWIYKTIHAGNRNIATWLHEHGYRLKDKKFRLFTFSHLQVRKIRTDHDRLIILEAPVHLIVSFHPLEIIEPFISGVFKDQSFVIGDKKSRAGFIISSVEKLPDPVFNGTMRYRCLSPMHIAKRNTETSEIEYLHPDHSEFKDLLMINLINKKAAFEQDQEAVNLHSTENAEFTLLNDYRKKGIIIKAGTVQETKIIGYMFDFIFKAHVEYQKIGYYCGFGKANSQGFGCVEVLNS